MESLEVSGKTVEEAIQNAMEDLGVARDNLEVTVIKEGKRGVFGVGNEDALISVKVISPPQSESPSNGGAASVAREILEGLLDRMGVAAEVEVQDKPADSGEGGEGQDVVNLNVTGDDLGILIGRRGQTLTSLQHIVRIIVAHQTHSHTPIVVDVEGYKQRRYEALQQMAWRIADQVKAKGRQFALEPMLPYERRIIHLTLATNPDVMTESVGEGDDRKVVIMPKRKSTRY